MKTRAEREAEYNRKEREDKARAAEFARKSSRGRSWGVAALVIPAIFMYIFHVTPNKTTTSSDNDQNLPITIPSDGITDEILLATARHFIDNYPIVPVNEILANGVLIEKNGDRKFIYAKIPVAVCTNHIGNVLIEIETKSKYVVSKVVYEYSDSSNSTIMNFIKKACEHRTVY